MVLSVRRGPMTPDVVLLEVRGDLEPSRGEVGILEALAQVLEVRRIATEEAAQLQRDAAEAEALEVGR